tara:strand:+ start:2879 stop:3562 length:684 start_codon:yes stop_codon:yes gene_type:complete
MKKGQVTSFWKKLETENLDMCASSTLFRLLKINGAKFNNKNVLDIGFGEGQNLIEFKKRGANIFGIELRKSKIKKILKNTKVKKSNFFNCDLNESFPKIKKKIDIIYTLDTFNYLTDKNQYIFFENCHKLLKKNGFFVIHYPQTQLKVKKKNKDLFNYEVSSNYKKSYFFGKDNPIIFLNKNKIEKLIKFYSKKLKLLSSIFDINTVSKSNSSKLTINRFILFKKIT